METGKNVVSESNKSNLILESRKKMSLTGVTGLIRLDDHNIVLNTNLGKLHIQGNELMMTKLDVDNNDVCVTGKIDSFAYSNSETKRENDSIISRLFR